MPSSSNARKAFKTPFKARENIQIPASPLSAAAPSSPHVADNGQNGEDHDMTLQQDGNDQSGNDHSEQRRTAAARMIGIVLPYAQVFKS